MPTDHEREALAAAARLLVPFMDDAMGFADDSEKLRDAEEAIDVLFAAGWRPRPEPGSPEEDAMVERMLVAETRAVCGDPDCCPEEYDDWDRSIATAVLRAALIPGDQA